MFHFSLVALLFSFFYEIILGGIIFFITFAVEKM
jgi:hypothetical protein